MKISNFYNSNSKNTPVRNCYSAKNRLNVHKSYDSVSFTANLERLTRETALSISSIANAYNDILANLSKKTPEGLEIIEKQYKNFKSGRGLTFHNCGDNNKTILVRVPDGKDGRSLIKVVVRRGSSLWDEKFVLDSFTIKDSEKLIEDNNKNSVFIFPDNANVLSFDKPVEENLKNILDNLDFAMLKFRQFLKNFDGLYLKPNIYNFNPDTAERIKGIESLYKHIDEVLKSLSSKTSLKLKVDFKDYKLQAKQPTHILRNIGDENNQVVYRRFDHPEHGKLTRLMVLNKNDEIIDGFLIKDDKHLISNFNSKNFSIIPPKLLYYDESSVKEVLPKFQKLTLDYEQKLKDFDKYIADFLYQKTLEPVIGKLDKDVASQMEIVNNIYRSITEKFSKMNATDLSGLKTSYPKWNAVGGQRGFIFKNSDGEKISVVKMSKSEDDDITRICFSKDGNVQYLLINKDNVVKNFNPKYPTMLPPILKYYSDVELTDLQLEPIVKKAAEEMQEFQKYIDTPKPVIKAEKPKSENNIEHIERKPKKEKVVKEKTRPRSSSKEYKALMNECNNMLTAAMKNAENNMQGFNEVLKEIQNKIAGFFAKSAE